MFQVVKVPTDEREGDKSRIRIIHAPTHTPVYRFESLALLSAPERAAKFRRIGDCWVSYDMMVDGGGDAVISIASSSV